jgi:O-methyltransferase involved in polyketide biosynthesis
MTTGASDTSEKPQGRKGDLSITALYTSQTWAWGGLPCAHLFETPEGKKVFDVTNAALAFAGAVSGGLPPLRHSLIHRHTMIDRLLGESGPVQVLELAAGLSRRGAAFTQEPSVRYTEIDLPSVVARKKVLLQRSEEGRAVLARPNFRFVGRDVESAPLDSWVFPNEPLFVIAEGLFMYLSPEKQRALWKKVASLFAVAGAGTFVFDLVPSREQPEAGAAGRALEAMMKRFTGGRAFEKDERTRDDIARELGEAGFGRVELLEPAHVAGVWELPSPEAPTQQLLFVCRPA